MQGEKKEKKNRFIVLNIPVSFVYPFMLSTSIRQSVMFVARFFYHHSSSSLFPFTFFVPLVYLCTRVPVALLGPHCPSLFAWRQFCSANFHAWAGTIFRGVHAYFPANDSPERAGIFGRRRGRSRNFSAGVRQRVRRQTSTR